MGSALAMIAYSVVVSFSSFGTASSLIDNGGYSVYNSSSSCNYCITDYLILNTATSTSHFVDCHPTSRSPLTIWRDVYSDLPTITSSTHNTTTASSSSSKTSQLPANSTASATGSPHKDSVGAGAIAGIVIGGIATLALIFGLTALVMLKKRRGTSHSALPVLVQGGMPMTTRNAYPATGPEKHLSTEYSMLSSPGSPAPQYSNSPGFQYHP